MISQTDAHTWNLPSLLFLNFTSLHFIFPFFISPHRNHFPFHAFNYLFIYFISTPTATRVAIVTITDIIIYQYYLQFPSPMPSFIGFKARHFLVLPSMATFSSFPFPFLSSCSSSSLSLGFTHLFFIFKHLICHSDSSTLFSTLLPYMLNDDMSSFQNKTNK